MVALVTEEDRRKQAEQREAILRRRYAADGTAKLSGPELESAAKQLDSGAAEVRAEIERRSVASKRERSDGETVEEGCCRICLDEARAPVAEDGRASCARCQQWWCTHCDTAGIRNARRCPFCKFEM